MIYTYVTALNLVLVSAYFQGVLEVFLWFRIVQGGRVLRRSVVQSAQSSVGCQVTWDLVLLGLENL